MTLANPDDCLLANPAGAEAIHITERLRSHGFVAYLAGGCVRDALLGRTPKDFDVATNATPDAVRECFGRRRTLAFGASFGVIGVLPQLPSTNATGATPIEVATFRSDGDYSDGRRPDSVHFGTAEQDALRRDFTINGLFYDPLERRVIDYVGGQDDLSRGLIRTIGHATERFGEDKLRMLRAVRFVTTLEMTLEPATFAAIRHHASDIDLVSGERIGAEMRRVLVAPAVARGLDLLHNSSLAEHVFPEWQQLDRTEAQGLLEAMQATPAQDAATAAATDRFSLALSLLLLPHPDAPIALQSLSERWRLSNLEQRAAGFALLHARCLVKGDSLPWSQLQPLLTDPHALTAIRTAECMVRHRALGSAGVDRCREALSWPAERLDPAPLLTGNDLQRLGLTPGPAFRTILQRVRDAQLDGEIRTRDEAVALVME